MNTKDEYRLVVLPQIIAKIGRTWSSSDWLSQKQTMEEFIAKTTNNIVDAMVKEDTKRDEEKPKYPDPFE